ncbi:MAG: ion transporter [Planctomycetota bacterium]|nr:ion transporter [Planctomycetota bacterium]
MSLHEPAQPGLRGRLHTVIFEADTPVGKAFDVALLLAILASIVVVSLESVAPIRAAHGALLRQIEWGLTFAFTAEYLLRLLCVQKPLRYARSFFGLVDLLAILPTWLSLVFVGTHSLVVIRALRLLRVFRVFKLGHFVREADVLGRALLAARRKILVFLGAVLTLVFILGTLMYLVEGEESGFSSIPESVYWAIVTLTTVGYGDIAPVTVLGKFIASVVMIAGYAIIAVPTGIVGVELARASQPTTPVSTQACPACGRDGHAPDAAYCKYCGAALHG